MQKSILDSLEPVKKLDISAGVAKPIDIKKAEITRNTFKHKM